MMSVQRVMKRAVYAGGCGTVVLFFVILLVLAGSSGRQPVEPLQPSTAPSYAAPVVEQVDVLRSATAIDVVAQIRNPNANAGAATLQVTFTPEEGLPQVIESYLPPGGVHYITLLNQPAASFLGDVTVSLAETTFSPLPRGIALPQFNTFARQRSLERVGEVSLETQQGVVGNVSTVDLQHVEVVGLARDASGQLVGVGRTFVGELRVGEERDVTLQWPAPASTTATATLVATTNIFAEDAVVRVIGDPSLLR